MSYTGTSPLLAASLWPSCGYQRNIVDLNVQRTGADVEEVWFCSVYVVKHWCMGEYSVWCTVFTGVLNVRDCLCGFLCVCTWSRCYLWHSAVAQPIKWWDVVIKGIVYWHACYLTIIFHICMSTGLTKPMFWRCRYTTCFAAPFYYGLVQTIKPLSQHTLLLLFVLVPLFLLTFFRLCCAFPYFACCHLSSLNHSFLLHLFLSFFLSFLLTGALYFFDFCFLF